MATAIVTMPDGRKARISGPDKASVLAEISNLKAAAAEPAESRFAGLPGEERGRLAEEIMGEPEPAGILGMAGDVARGAALAAADIPAAIEQIGVRGSRFAGIPEPFLAGPAGRVEEYERAKQAQLTRPGAGAGYLLGQIGTAFLPGTGAAAAAGRLASVAKPVAVGAGLTALRPQETEADRAKAVLESVTYGAAGGAAVTGLSILGRGAKKGVKRVFLGGEVLETTGERASRAAQAEKMGYKLTVGEVSGNKRLQVLEDASENMLGGTAFAKLRAHNKETTNKLLSRRVGEESAEISSEWLAKTADDIGTEFEAIRALPGNININLDLARFEKAAATGRLVGGKKLEKIVAEVRKRFKEGMSFDEYADLRSEWSQAAVAMPDRNMARHIGDFVGILDDAASRSAPGAANLQRAASKYREFLLIRNATDESGDILRGKLISGVSKMRRGKFATAKPGEDELIDVARTLNTFKNQVPSSGTAERLQAMKTIEAIGQVPGIIKRAGLGAAGYALGDVTGLLGGAVAPAAAQRVLMSPALRRYLEKDAPRTRLFAQGLEAEPVSRAVRLGAILGGY